MAKSRKPIVAGNWKMNGSIALVRTFIDSVYVSEDVETVLCVPSPYLAGAGRGDYALGAQDCSCYEAGAHTGDVSISMLKEMGVEYVIVGHSERRQDHKETDEMVASKVQLVLNSGLVPILCVGEPLEVRESGNFKEYVLKQLSAVKDVCGSVFLDNTVIAYEPIWAIGTGKTATPEQAQEVHQFIRDNIVGWNDVAVNTRILYGGSVNAANAEQLFAQQDIDGGLIGGASLKLNDFNAIISAAK